MNTGTVIAIISVAYFGMIASFVVFAKTPAEQSIECVKAGGQWVSSTLDNHCERKGS